MGEASERGKLAKGPDSKRIEMPIPLHCQILGLRSMGGNAVRMRAAAMGSKSEHEIDRSQGKPRDPFLDHAKAVADEK